MPQIQVVALAHISGRKLLLVRSSGKNGFYLPGGKPQDGESDLVTLAREIREELDRGVDPSTVSYYTTTVAQAFGKPDGVMVAVKTLRGDLVGSLRPASEVVEIRCFGVADCMAMPVRAPAAEALLGKLAQQGLVEQRTRIPEQSEAALAVIAEGSKPGSERGLDKRHRLSMQWTRYLALGGGPPVSPAMARPARRSVMKLMEQVEGSLLSRWLPRALKSLSKSQMLKLLDVICTLNPGWKENVAFTTELIQKEHPFYQWARAMAADLHPRAFERFVRNAVLDNFVADRRQAEYEAEHGAPPLSNIVISVTERCNLKCEGCWASEYDKRDDLPLSLLDRIIGELKEMRANFVTFTGGEPFMRKDLLDLVEAHPEAIFQVYTNGTLITPELGDRLQELGNVIPLVSVNGFERENDAIRGPGNFAAVVRAFDLLRERGILFGVSLTATSRNLSSLLDVHFYDFLIGKGAKIGWVFQYMPVGRNPTLDLMLSPEQRRELGQFIYKVRNSRPFFIADFWNDGALIGGCMAGGRQYIHITNRAEVEPCVFCHFSVDSIKDKSLHEVIRSPFFTDIRNRAPYDGNLLRPCMMVDRPEVFRSHVQKHAPRPTHPGAETLVGALAAGLDRRAAGVKTVMDEVWQRGEFATFYTFDPRWYNALH